MSAANNHFKGTSINENFSGRVRKHRAQNRSLLSVNEDSSTELTQLSQKKTVFRDAFNYFCLMISSLMLGGCFLDDTDDYTGCASSSDYFEFQCIHRNDFKSADGTRTPASQNIANCTILSSKESPCDLNTLPFIASESTTPSKAQILSRVIVSHAWMAENFSALLDNMPPDMYKLFASVTAIVIHDEIRPAFFWDATGAIYIDPYYLWITRAQYNTISQDPDYRSGYDDNLSFISLARYANNGEYAFASGNTRTETQTLHALSALLFHELAHARDTFPLAGIVSAGTALTPADIAAALDSERVSTGLQDTYPLQDTTLFALANVMYKGFTPTDYLKGITATEVGSLLAADIANDDYGYTSTYEDMAMLFEEAMMKIHYGIDREIAYATPLNRRMASCDDFSFDWTTINRFADDAVIPRVSYVVDGLLPGHSHKAFLNNPVADGIFSWCTSVTPYRITPQARPDGTDLDNFINHPRWH